MKLNNISLPYPVLGISDDIMPGLTEDSVSVNEYGDINNFYFDISLKFDNPDIKKLIETDKAEYSCEVDCKRTVFRKCFKSKDPSFKIELSRKGVGDEIEFNCYVSVKSSIQNYVNSGFNKDYEGFSFDLEPGDILVGFPQFRYLTDIKYDKLQAAGSFMNICEDKNAIETSFDLNSDKIEILLPTKMFNSYKNGLGRQFAEIMHSSLAFNALTCGLYEIGNNKGTSWAKTITYRLKTEDNLKSINYDLDDDGNVIKIDNVPELAIKLLKDPYKRMFDYLENSKQDLLEDN